MPYILMPGGGKTWEGPRTEDEEMALMRKINRVRSFPSANHRAATLRNRPVSPQEQQRKQPEE